MKFFLKVLAVLIAVLYPVVIYITLSHYDASPRVLAALLVFIALVYFIAHTDNARGETTKQVQFWGMIIVVGALALITFVTENAGYVKIYPVFINVSLLLSFGITLFRPPSMIFRLASMQDKIVRDSEGDERLKIERYCRKVTIVWVIFFILNGLTAILTALFTSHFVWALYNGMISYILIGIIFVGDIIVRKVAT